MSYQLYRNTTLGNTLQETLDELIQFQQISPNTALKVLLQFDRAINTALANKVRARINFKANKLNTYRFCDNVWTFLMSDVEFREVQDFAQVDKLKIVACDGRGPIKKGERRKGMHSERRKGMHVTKTRTIDGRKRHRTKQKHKTPKPKPPLKRKRRRPPSLTQEQIRELDKRRKHIDFSTRIWQGNVVEEIDNRFTPQILWDKLMDIELTKDYIFLKQGLDEAAKISGSRLLHFIHELNTVKKAKKLPNADGNSNTAENSKLRPTLKPNAAGKTNMKDLKRTEKLKNPSEFKNPTLKPKTGGRAYVIDLKPNNEKLKNKFMHKITIKIEQIEPKDYRNTEFVKPTQKPNTHVNSNFKDLKCVTKKQKKNIEFKKCKKLRLTPHILMKKLEKIEPNTTRILMKELKRVKQKTGKTNVKDLKHTEKLKKDTKFKKHKRPRLTANILMKKLMEIEPNTGGILMKKLKKIEQTTDVKYFKHSEKQKKNTEFVKHKKPRKIEPNTENLECGPTQKSNTNDLEHSIGVKSTEFKEHRKAESMPKSLLKEKEPNVDGKPNIKDLKHRPTQKPKTDGKKKCFDNKNRKTTETEKKNNKKKYRKKKKKIEKEAETDKTLTEKEEKTDRLLTDTEQEAETDKKQTEIDKPLTVKEKVTDKTQTEKKEETDQQQVTSTVNKKKKFEDKKKKKINEEVETETMWIKNKKKIINNEAEAVKMCTENKKKKMKNINNETETEKKCKENKNKKKKNINNETEIDKMWTENKNKNINNEEETDKIWTENKNKKNKNINNETDKMWTENKNKNINNEAETDGKSNIKDFRCTEKQKKNSEFKKHKNSRLMHKIIMEIKPNAEFEKPKITPKADENSHAAKKPKYSTEFKKLTHKINTKDLKHGPTQNLNAYGKTNTKDSNPGTEKHNKKPKLTAEILMEKLKKNSEFKMATQKPTGNLKRGPIHKPNTDGNFNVNDLKYCTENKKNAENLKQGPTQKPNTKYNTKKLIKNIEFKKPPKTQNTDGTKYDTKKLVKNTEFKKPSKTQNTDGTKHDSKKLVKNTEFKKPHKTQTTGGNFNTTDIKHNTKKQNNTEFNKCKSPRLTRKIMTKLRDIEPKDYKFFKQGLVNADKITDGRM